MPKTVPCPQCGEKSIYDPSNPYRPFCSERCQMIDLGKWSNEEYSIPDNSTQVNEDDLEEAERKQQRDPKQDDHQQRHSQHKPFLH